MSSSARRRSRRSLSDSPKRRIGWPLARSRVIASVGLMLKASPRAVVSAAAAAVSPAVGSLLDEMLPAAAD
jgi:hypothetical protein